MDSRRSVLEVIKFLSAIDVLKHTSLVSRSFQALSDSEEVWYELLSSQNYQLSKGNPKSQYRYCVTLYIPVVKNQRLWKLYVKPALWKSVALDSNIEIQLYASIVRLSEQCLFITGNISPDTFSIQPQTGSVTILQSMLLLRRNVGLIEYHGKAYAFCGYTNTYKVVCDVYEDSNWRSLPDATYARSNFNPCEWEGRIYLIGGCGTAKAESFDVKMEKFATLEYCVEGELCTIAVVVQGEVVVVNRRGYYTSLGVKFNNFKFDLGSGFWSNFPAIELGNTIYVSQAWKQSIVALDLKDLSFKAYPIDNRSTTIISR